MKLRNKKTGEIIEPDRVVVIKNTKETDTASFNRISANYYSLAKLNEEWEDYKPAEPLIKDEKIRKAVRAWADNLRDVMVDGEITFYVDKAFCTFQTDVWKDYGIRYIAELDLVLNEDSLEDGKLYTITELCGEEEE